MATLLVIQLIRLLLIAAVLAAAVVVIIMIVRWLTTFQRESRMITDGSPIRLQDRGNQLTAPIDLDAGTYKVMYWLPDDELVKIDLINIDNGESETLLIKSGSGSHGVIIHHAGRYAFQVEPDGVTAPWTLEILPLGLVSKRL